MFNVQFEMIEAGSTNCEGKYDGVGFSADLGEIRDAGAFWASTSPPRCSKMQVRKENCAAIGAARLLFQTIVIAT